MPTLFSVFAMTAVFFSRGNSLSEGYSSNSPGSKMDLATSFGFSNCPDADAFAIATRVSSVRVAITTMRMREGVNMGIFIREYAGA